MGIAWRYLRSRKGSRLLSFITVVAIGGVVVGVSALILIMGVMNGLQNDLRDKILVGSPDLRVLELRRGPADRRLANRARQGARHFTGVVAAAPFVLTQGAGERRAQLRGGGQVVGIDAPGAARAAGDDDPRARDASAG